MEDKGFIPIILLLFVFILGIISIIIGNITTGFAQGLRGSATVDATYEEIRIDNDVQSSFSLDQRYLLGLDSELTPLLRWRTDIRDLESLDDTDEGRTTGRDTELFSELILQNPMFNFGAGIRLGRDVSKDPESPRERLNKRDIFSRFRWRPEKLPSLFLQYDNRREYDDFPVRERDTDEDRFQVTSDYTYGPLSLFDNFTYVEREDRVLNLTDKDIENVGRVNFERDFWRKKISLLGNYQVNYTRRKEIAEADVSFDRVQLPGQGLYEAQDTTPATGQLTGTPSLIDSDKNTPATDGLGNTINIGGGNTFRNIGVELTAAAVGDRIFIYVIPGDPDLSGLISWDAYFSDDGQNWSLVGSTTVFNVSESRYEISFTESNPHRFFKAVNSATSGVLDSFVTEIEVTRAETLAAGEEAVSTDLIQDINSTVRFRPIERVTLSYDFFYSRSERERDDGELTAMRNTHGITLEADPVRWLSYYVRYERALSESEENVETVSNLYTVTLRSAPWETLEASFSATRDDTDEDDVDQSRRDTFSLEVISQLYRNLNMTAGADYTDRRDFVARTKTTGQNYRLDLDAELRRDLTATLSYDGARSVEKPGDIRTETDDVGLLLIWRPTRLLSLTGEWGFRRESESEGFDQRYTVDWLPFPDGNINFDLTLELQDFAIEDSQRQRLSANFRWAVNRKTDFRLTYTFLESQGAIAEEIHTLNSSLDIRF